MFTVVAIDSAMYQNYKYSSISLLLENNFNKDEIIYLAYDQTGNSFTDIFGNIKELVKNKDEWRLILVGDSDNDVNNPFDCAEDPNFSSRMIKLVSYFGEIPPEIKINHNKDITITPFENEITENFNPPDHLYLLAVVQSKTVTKKVNHDFWNRGNYPAKCRFIKYNLLNENHIVNEHSYLKFWLSLQTLAQNMLSSSSLQAYQLYQLSIELNYQKLFEKLDAYYSHMLQLEDNLKTMYSNLERQKQQYLNHEALFNFNEKVNISFNLEKVEDMTINKHSFKLFKNEGQKDIEIWLDKRNLFFRSLKNTLQLPQRELKKASHTTRMIQKKIPEEIKKYTIDEFEQTLIKEKLIEAELALINSHPKNLLTYQAYQKKLSQVEKEVYQTINHRPSKKKVFLLGTIMIICVLLAMITNVIMAVNDKEILLILTIAFIIAIVFISFALFLGMYKIHQKLLKVLDDYSHQGHLLINSIERASESYSNYLSHLASLLKGNKMLNIINNQEDYFLREKNKINVHLNYIHQGLKKVDYLANILQHRLVKNIFIERTIDLNIEIKPENNYLYEFNQEQEEFLIPLNESIKQIRTTNEYIKEIKLEKEVAENEYNY